MSEESDWAASLPSTEETGRTAEEMADYAIEVLVKKHGGHLRLWLLRRFADLGELVGEVINDAL